MSKKVVNPMTALAGENAKCLKDAGVIVSGKKMFDMIDKGTPDSMKFFVKNPVGKALFASSLAAAAATYNNVAFGTLSTCLLSSALDDIAALVTSEALAEGRKVIAKVVAENPSDSSTDGAELHKELIGENGGEPRFNFGLEPEGKKAPADVKPEGPKQEPKQPEKKDEPKPASKDNTYWPVKDNQLTLNNQGKAVCPLCDKGEKKNKMALVEVLDGAGNKRSVLACRECRKLVQEHLDAEQAKEAAAKAEADAITKAKEGEAEYFANKTKLTAIEAEIAGKKKKVGAYKAMLDAVKAGEDNSMEKAAFDAAEAAVVALETTWGTLVESIEAYEKKQGMSTPKPDSKQQQANAKGGVLERLGVK